jgi:hypothetical protein
MGLRLLNVGKSGLWKWFLLKSPQPEIRQVAKGISFLFCLSSPLVFFLVVG